MVYLDYASGSPVDSRVIDFALPFLMEKSANPSSLHNKGLKTKHALEEARQKIASFIHAETPSSVFFTGSATEANNLAVRGMAYRNRSKGSRLLLSAIEHISVINAIKELQKNGFVPTLGSNEYYELSFLYKHLNLRTLYTFFE